MMKQEIKMMAYFFEEQEMDFIANQLMNVSGPDKEMAEKILRGMRYD